MVHKALPRRVKSRFRKCRFHRVRYSLLCPLAFLTPDRRKVWDTFTGTVLHSFPHNHIVRSVSLGPSSTHLLTGGQEKKVRIFDLARPDAEPDFLLSPGATLTHEGTVKSVVWVGENTGVTAGEDGQVKSDPSFDLVCRC